ncbi:MAG: FAD-dependent 5-carboxymethylaminomethyl-2-thiouridine(34) oxidoreductase MnmC [Burkholderiaceae bacterium]|nr:FAD-dependent 5-carboxymethylaminomethyl-2-thiouridine(34) oxidoreductase MnmC [Burkholderiaceae bacterium]
MIPFGSVFAALGVPQVWVRQRAYTIIDADFGDGRFFLHLWNVWRGDPQRSRRLHVVGLLSRLSDPQALRERLLQVCPAEMAVCVHQLVEAWPLNLSGIHRLEFEGGRITLTLAVGDASTLLQRLSVRADALVLSSSMRSAPLEDVEVMFAAAKVLLVPHGKLVMPWPKVDEQATSLWAQGAVHDGVWSYMDCTISTTTAACQERPCNAVIIGGGFAGAGVAHAMALRGWSVTVLEATEGEQGPHRGHLAAALTPMLTRDDDVRARLSRAGTLRAHHRWGHLSAEAFDPCGALQLLRTSGRIVDLESVVAELQLPETWARFVDANQASAIAGLKLDRGGIHFPMAVRVQPEPLINQLLATTGITRQVARVHRLLRRGDVWDVLDAAGQVLAQSPIVVLAAAHATQDILSASGLLSDDARLRAMHPLGGEVTYVPDRLMAGGPRCIVSGDGYVLPAVDAHCVTGSSYLHGADRVVVSSDGAKSNLQRAEGLLDMRLVEAGSDSCALNGWAGWRAVLPGRLPAIGAVDDEESLWVVAGLASRGLTWSSLAGDLIAAALNGEPLPLETDIIDKISQI